MSDGQSSTPTPQPDGNPDGNPILLDLNGDGVSLTELGHSAITYDMGGDGLQRRTAWAGAGDGVLAVDADGDGQINRREEVVFTAWDPTASDDMQALADVFDTNRNGRLDAGDTRFAAFRVVVTNADGTTTLKTLAELGITSINLSPDGRSVTFDDGSSIHGQSTFTRTDGSTGIAANVSLASDGAGYRTSRTVATNADGSVTIETRAFDASGALVNIISQQTSPDRAHVVIRTDAGGDGVIDRVQDTLTVANGDGSRTTTVSNSGPGNHLIDRTVTTVGSNHVDTLISRDRDGNGTAEETDNRVLRADGSIERTLSAFHRDSTLASRQVELTSPDGLVRTVTSYTHGGVAAEQVAVNQRVNYADGTFSDNVSVMSGDRSTVTANTQTQTHDHGRQTLVAHDLNGDGLWDAQEQRTITLDAAGGTASPPSKRGLCNLRRDHRGGARVLNKPHHLDANQYFHRVA